MSVITDNSSIDLSLTNIWRAWVAFRRGKQPSRDIVAFEINLEYNLLRLCVDLNAGQYEHGGYHHRIVNEKKRRDIAVASVRDRVVHRLLYDYLVPLVDLRLDYDAWSCRRNKGLHKALQRSQHLLSSSSQGCGYTFTVLWTTLFVYMSFKHPIKIGVRIACGNSQGNHQLQTCLQSRSFGPAKGRANPSSPSQENNCII